MAKPNHVKIGQILKGFVHDIDPKIYEDLVEEFAQFLDADNETFDKAKFEKTCGIDELGLLPRYRKE